MTNPYKGANSYQTSDARLFFGRDQDAERVITRVMNGRFTLLHAQSGAGKTSLLNARIIPGLEARGWLPIRVIPQDDPVESIRVTVGETLLPPLTAEVQALELACNKLGSAEGVGQTLGKLLEMYDKLKEDDPRQRELISPDPQAAQQASSNKGASPNPYVWRLLRSGMTIKQFTEHFEVIRQLGAGDNLREFNFTKDTTIQELKSVLSDPVLAAAWEKARDGLNIPSLSLWPFFENLFLIYGSRRTRFGIVLLLDQFEEIFTRFVDRGEAGAQARNEQPDWRRRRELLNEIRTLYYTETQIQGEISNDDQVGGLSHLPLRFLISMRDEYVAQMIAQLGRDVITDWDAASYHLAMLTVPQADEAIKRPASKFKHEYSDELYRDLISQLTQEERYVEPAHLQIVCEKIWARKGDGEFKIGPNVLGALGGVPGILKSFFKEFLHNPKFAEGGKRLEILEILEPLITANGTRNIIRKEDLVEARFHHPHCREELLKELERRSIVRVEPRLGGSFVEITHEFLIEPIREEIGKELADLDYRAFRAALDSMEQLLPLNAWTLPERLLSPSEFKPLHSHAERLQWDDRAKELMLRSAIVLDEDRNTIAKWLNDFSAVEWDEEKFLGATGQFDGKERLNLEQLRVFDERRERLSPGASGQLASILRSQIILASGAERAAIVYWTRRMTNEET
jgi:hypothetical protein